MATFNHIGGAEPSTVTFKLRTIQQTQNSSAMQQEIISLGDPDSSAAVASVLNTTPASTAWALSVREVAPSTGPFAISSIAGPVTIQGNSTVVQGTSPWISQTTFPSGYISSGAQSGNSSGLTVRPVWSSSGVDQPVRALLSSTRADNLVSVDGQSTVIQGTNPWVIGFQAANISSVAQSGNSSGLTVRPVWSSSNVDQPVRAGQGVGNSSGADAWPTFTVDSSNTIVKPGDSANNAIRVNVIAGSAASTIVTVAAFGSGAISSGVVAGNSSALTVRNVWSSSNADQPVSAAVSSFPVNSSLIQINAIAAGYVSTSVPAAGSSGLNVWLVGGNRLNIGSTAADNAVTATPNYGALQSSAAGSSNSSALMVRPIIDVVLTVASTNAFASTTFTIQSSAAGIRSYVTAFTIMSTNAGPSKVKFYDGSSMIWPVIFAAVSSAVSGAHLAVTPPGYIFRGSQANALTLQLGSSLAGFQVAVSYFRAP